LKGIGCVGKRSKDHARYMNGLQQDWGGVEGDQNFPWEGRYTAHRKRGAVIGLQGGGQKIVHGVSCIVKNNTIQNYNSTIFTRKNKFAKKRKVGGLKEAGPRSRGGTDKALGGTVEHKESNRREPTGENATKD